MIGYRKLYTLLFITILSSAIEVKAQQSVAREWNEVTLDAIRGDFARPTVHARNLFHSAVAMYDAWAAYDDVASTFLLGKTVSGFYCPFSGIKKPADIEKAREEAISYAAYRLLSHRFSNSPGTVASLARFNALMATLGYDINFTDSDYTSGSPAALGNYIGKRLIEFGLQDGANESGGYVNEHYQPVNPPLTTMLPGNPDMLFPNRWQPLAFDVFIDQAGNVITGAVPAFLGPEWGKVVPFSLEEDDLSIYQRDGGNYYVYHDPGPPPYLGGELSDEYKWGFALVAAWSSHLDPDDNVMIDISPASLGNIQTLPQSFAEYRNFYDLTNGGSSSVGHQFNPRTGISYDPQIVPRGDYSRVLAEFWADGPDSETPPGHWFTILNYVSDHPLLEKRLEGQGSVLSDLEWDVKSYLALGGAMHDCAITAWGIKGWYDYVRPVSAIRYMAGLGQSTDPDLPNYHVNGIPLIEGFIELIQPGDPLDDGGNNVNKIKLYTWRGPNYINNPATDKAGVGWILGSDWWPYQRPSFVTPPFAGYLSGHSTFSRAAAETLTLLTGDEFFPGGLAEFNAPKNSYLVFEEGPSVDIVLQWATYRDASDQTSLSRIWGGIHPPADDIKGRLIGRKIGIKSYSQAKLYFEGAFDEDVVGPLAGNIKAYPNPISRNDELILEVGTDVSSFSLSLIDTMGKVVRFEEISIVPKSGRISLIMDPLPQGIYIINVNGSNINKSLRLWVM